jgi:hypothetical protein
MIVSHENELKFIKMNALESDPYIDKILVCEANYTHSGIKRPFIFKELIEKHFKDDPRIVYVPLDIESKVHKDTMAFKSLHYNERIIRGYFIEHIQLKSDDIVFSVDADEIIYKKSYPHLLSLFGNKKRQAFKLRLNNFIYRPDYFWKSMDFIAPTVCTGNYYKFSYRKYNQWRYHGELIEEPMGCHFNWHLTPAEMLQKINNYSHKDRYHHMNDIKVFEDAIRNKEYPFEKDLVVDIEQIDLNENKDLYPESFLKLIDEFKYLM